jgi:hypothetical protein
MLVVDLERYVVDAEALVQARVERAAHLVAVGLLAHEHVG